MNNTTMAEVEATIDELCEMYDDAERSGNRDLAADFASQLEFLMRKYPENKISLSTKH